MNKLYLSDRPYDFITCAAGEGVYDALASAGYGMRKSCRNGVCEICESRLIEGKAHQRYPEINFDVQKGEPPALCFPCTLMPITDLRIDIEGLQRPGEIPVNRVTCEITETEKLNHDVYRVRMAMPETPAHGLPYKAGQYLDIILPSGKQASFSIGSAPEQGRALELHIRHMADSEMSNAIMDHLLNNSTVDIELPKGDCFLDLHTLNPETRYIFAAASTGFAQIKSVVEHLLANQVKNDIHVYWGARIEEDMYLEALPFQWAKEHANVHFDPVLSEPENSPNWQGRTGLLPAAVLEDYADFENVEIFTSGSPAMVYALLDAAETKGFSQDNMHSDVFAYAPRPAKS
ncbi:MAG: FAD-binding oxidoreductase [Pontibacterium sp.]